MTDAAFDSWVTFHIAATAADDRALEALYVNRPIITGDMWAATAEELRLATQRLVAFARTPKFANEHVDAIERELSMMRTENAAAAKAEQQRAIVAGCDCPACNGGRLLPKYSAAVDRYRRSLVSLAAGMAPPRRKR